MREKFITYFLSFYGRDGIYSRWFKTEITPIMVDRALKLIEPYDNCYDSLTRERLRDVFFYMNGHKDIEHMDFIEKIMSPSQ